MKKYLLGILTVALAVSLSAFSAVSHKSGKVQPPLYYWYDLSGNILNGGAKTAEPSTGCTTNDVGCARGFSDETDNPQGDHPQAVRKQNSK